MRHGLPYLIIATLVSAPLAGANAGAQTVTIDEGSFRVSVDGESTGSEIFSIRRIGEGANAQIIATGEIRARLPEGTVELRPALQVTGGPEMSIAAYQIRTSGDREEEIFVTLGDGRFLTSIRSARGEQEREMRAVPGTVLLDAGIAHQYFFLAQRRPSVGSSIPVIVPREGRQFELRVTAVRSESLTIGGQQVSASRLQLSANGEQRDLWVDQEGRVLALARPETGYRATRERAP